MRRQESSKTVAEAIEWFVGPDLPIGVETYDGGRIGPCRRPGHAGGPFARRAPADPDRSG
jgi:hypothetical protein